MYIESVYYIKQKDDNSAINALQHLIQINPETPVSKKAENMMDVLKRRDEIEKYLTNLDIKRAEEDSVAVVEEKPKAGVQEQVKALTQPKALEVAAAKETIIKPAIDSSVFNRPKPAPQAGFSYDPSAQHYVAVVLNKVDIVYGNEAKNAFNRYNRESFNDQQIEITILPLDDDNKLMLMSGFSDAVGALDYVSKLKRVAGAQVIPWLAAEKYSFIVISANNLEVLKNNKDLGGYKQFIEANYPAQ